ncbi:hypothetical protein [Mesonia aquimarina]|uniref:hypothetical protein n=1 Tax=Mesonia aquimarina TaxID=1504967 RepID=UPI000EF5AA43|nr:hypothetical protein [Mesonia aquimarina]
MKAEFIFLLLFFMTINIGSAQDSITDQDVKINRQLWLDYNFSARINDDMQVNTQAAYRNISPKVYNRFMLFPTLVAVAQALNFKNTSSI